MKKSDQLIVKSTGKGKFQHDILVGDRHMLKADEPQNMGGDDTGPAPYDFLNAALGACKAMTIRMYADHKGLPLENVNVSVIHEKREVDGKKVDHFDCEIEIIGDELTQEQKDRMVEIAEKCPVHKTISGEVRISGKAK